MLHATVVYYALDTPVEERRVCNEAPVSLFSFYTQKEGSV